MALDTSGNVYFCDTERHLVKRWLKNPPNVFFPNPFPFVGTQNPGYSGDGGPANTAQLNFPQDVILSQSGDMYIADTHNHAIRKVNLITNIISTVAGGKGAGYTGDGGLATDARLNFPRSLMSDAAGNIYIADLTNQAIRKIDPAGYITTIAGGSLGGGVAVLGIAIDSAGAIYATDGNDAVYIVDQATGGFTRIAGGNGKGNSGDGGFSAAALLDTPAQLAIGTDGSIYVVVSGNNALRRNLQNYEVKRLSIYQSKQAESTAHQGARRV
eukprot:gene29837-17939_t